MSRDPLPGTTTGSVSSFPNTTTTSKNSLWDTIYDSRNVLPDKSCKCTWFLTYSNYYIIICLLLLSGNGTHKYKYCWHQCFKGWTDRWFYYCQILCYKMFCFVFVFVTPEGLPQWWLTRAWRGRKPRSSGTISFTSPPKGNTWRTPTYHFGQSWVDS